MRTRPLSRVVAGSLLTAVWILAVAAPAHASSVMVQPSATPDLDELMYVAVSGEHNNVTLRARTDADTQLCCVWTVRDPGAVIAPAASCTSVDPHTARCFPQPLNVGGDLRELATARVAVGDLDDRLRVKVPDYSGARVLAAGGPGDDLLRATTSNEDELDGGDGDDVLYGLDGDDHLQGGAGDDKLFGGLFFDVLDGGGGRDELHGQAQDDQLIDGDQAVAIGDAGPGPDVLDGGRGNDRVSYRTRKAPVFVNLADSHPDGERGERDVLRRIEGIAGGRGNDRLAGTDRPDELDGGRGHNRLIGRGGNDLLTNGGGAISCGAGEDTVVQVRRPDYVKPGCEEIERFFDNADYLALRPYPSSVAAWRADFRIGCPGRGGQPFACSGTVTVSSAEGRHRVLATGAFPKGRWSRRTVPAWFTSLGHRLASRRHGVLAAVKVDGARFSAPVRWTIRLKTPR